MTEPQAFSKADVQEWLSLNSSRADVINYLATAKPTYGIIVKDEVAPGVTNTLILFIPTDSNGNPLGGTASEVLRITLVDANASIVKEIQKAPFTSPDDVGFWQNLKNELDKFMGSATTMIEFAVIGLIAIAVIQLVRK